MKPRTVAVIQARMGSRRLPGKVMMPIGGQPLLRYLVRRILRAKTLDEVVVATTRDMRDDVIVEECETQGVPCFRGSAADVLSRYVAAAEIWNAGIVVRVTADNPFTDPESIDRVVESILVDGAEYAIETKLPLGSTGEALTADALSLIDAVALAPRWREHVTLYAKENPGALRCAFLEPPPGLARPDLRFTVDTPNDYLQAKKLADSLPNTTFGLKKLIETADESLVMEHAG
jgi:spore coat polysaccharide biosynthesis protein SpsF